MAFMTNKRHKIINVAKLLNKNKLDNRLRKPVYHPVYMSVCIGLDFNHRLAGCDFGQTKGWDNGKMGF